MPPTLPRTRCPARHTQIPPSHTNNTPYHVHPSFPPSPCLPPPPVVGGPSAHRPAAPAAFSTPYHAKHDVDNPNFDERNATWYDGCINQLMSDPNDPDLQIVRVGFQGYPPDEDQWM